MFCLVFKAVAGTLAQRRIRSAALGLCLLLSTISAHAADIDVGRLVDQDTIETWHRKKDGGRSTFAGTDAWRSHMLFLERQLAARGVVDIGKRFFSYERWSVADTAVDVPYEFFVDSESVEVASAWAYSGGTDVDGVTAPLIYYTRKLAPESMAEKIVVFDVGSVPDSMRSAFIAGNVYSTDTTPPEEIGLAGDQWYQGNVVTRFGRFDDVLRDSGALGGAVIFDMSPGRARGLYTFPLLNAGVVGVPGLYFDRVAGEKIRLAAQRGEQATLVLHAREGVADAWFMHGFLPGRAYGTDDDELVLLVTHSDGPNLTQENGTLGILGAIDYFSRIPVAERGRSLLVLLDPQHYMPGRHTIDWYAEHAELTRKIVASVGVEQLGQREYVETGNDYALSGHAEQTLIFVQDNERLIETAIAAVDGFDIPRTDVRVPSRGGQGMWAGLGDIAIKMNMPGFALSSAMSGYWSTEPGIESFDAELFSKQLGALVMMTTLLMDADPGEIAIQSQDPSTNPALSPGVPR